MRLAVSNIGWTAAEDAGGGLLARLRDAGAGAVEVAPGRLFADPAAATAAEVETVRAGFAAAGLPVVSMQALLFGRPDLALFGGSAAEAALLAHLGAVIGLAGKLGCGPLVFGAPKNRLRGTLDPAEARMLARPIFARIADLAAASGTVFCLEANAPAYGCDFMTVLAEAAEMARAVAGPGGHPGIGLVADTGNMLMADEPAEALLPVLPQLTHLHASAPHLGPVAPHMDYVARVVGLARDAGWKGVVTLEMRPGTGTDPTADLLRATALLAGLLARS